MANDLNACHFTGRLGADPEVRFLPSGDAVANIRLAVGKTWRDKQSGSKQEATSWINCVAFKKTAELAQQYLTKGSQIRVSCEVRERKWQDQQGNNRNAIEFVIRDMQFLGSGQQQGGNSPQGGYGQGMPQQGYQQPPQGQAPQGGQQQPPPQQGGNQGAPDPGAFDDFDSEIPF
ncbi:single-stranded DNA-binding protein [Halomonas sp. SSL-5]|uniref:single-stranded DNA-binding protein n=1 Tax=Halomonas sp. SSL-5 TaxID=3065855 RepID=UPI002738D741|nr:single-stranded DNA-binding protein [Halomonas sp. SSL-5]MDY7116556.1 single-stranded DNA-binding protein [Halomonas sp. SSL-5]